MREWTVLKPTSLINPTVKHALLKVWQHVFSCLHCNCCSLFTIGHDCTVAEPCLPRLSRGTLQVSVNTDTGNDRYFWKKFWVFQSKASFNFCVPMWNHNFQHFPMKKREIKNVTWESCELKATDSKCARRLHSSISISTLYAKSNPHQHVFGCSVYYCYQPKD